MSSQEVHNDWQATNDWHLREVDELTQAHGVDPAQGLQAHQINDRMRQFGANALPSAERRSLWHLLLDQLNDFMILVLLAAAVVSGVVGDRVDALVIMLIVVLNATLGLVQTWRADQALAALQRLSTARATVLRGGLVQQVPAHVLVPGDIVLLEAGNQVPADIRLIKTAQLKLDESALTGESVTVDKHTNALQGHEHAVGDRLNMAFKGTTATHGRGHGLVVATGLSTEMGKVASLMQQDTQRSTPLQLRLSALGKRVALVVLAICVLIFGVGILRGEAPLLMAMTAISLAVAAIPEALPAVVAVLLALGARKMVAMNALIRRLPAVETLGSVTTICTDKTGTLTQNRMQVQCLITGQAPSDQAANTALLQAAALCNDATAGPQDTWLGDPTETALTRAAAQAGLVKALLEQQWPRVMELPFDSVRKRMSTLHRAPAGWLAYTKGAPESVLPLCNRQWSAQASAVPVPFEPDVWLARAEALAAQGLRVLAFAQSTALSADDATCEIASVERNLCLMGLIGLIDPPREEAAAAVRACWAAGISPVMITGDHPATARAIALQLGIVATNDAPVLTGTDLATMDDAALLAQVKQVRVYARVDPGQKIRIVQALQTLGEFVAMTGDGINDAPALRQADIGIAMGLGGTDVAREAAGLVLLDDNFATIVKAVREGRRIYDNIRKFVRYAMTGNSAEVWTIFLAPLLLLPIPLLPIHILWVNLVTDGLPGLALAAEPAERGIMQRPPRAPDENIFAQGMWQHILGVGLLLGGLCLGIQAWALATGHAHWQTMVFTVLTLGQMAHVLAIRSEMRPSWTLGFASNKPLLGAVLLSLGLQLATIYVPFLQPIFKTEPLSMAELGLCIGAAGVVWVAVEIEKAWRCKQRASCRAYPDSHGGSSGSHE